MQVVEAKELPPKESRHGKEYYQAAADHSSKYVVVRGADIDEVRNALQSHAQEAAKNGNVDAGIRKQLAAWTFQNPQNIDNPNAKSYGKHAYIGAEGYDDVGALHQSHDSGEVKIVGEPFLRVLTQSGFFPAKVVKPLESPTLNPYHKKYCKGPFKNQEIPALEQEIYRGRDLREALIAEIHRVGREDGENPKASKLATMHVNKLFTAMMDAANKAEAGAGYKVSMTQEQIQNLARDVQTAATKDLENLDKVNQHNKERYGTNARNASPEVSKAFAAQMEEHFTQAAGNTPQAQKVVEAAADKYISLQAKNRMQMETGNAVKILKGDLSLYVGGHMVSLAATRAHMQGSHRSR